MSTDKVNRTLVDQITDGQVQWDKLDEEFDIVSIGIFYYLFIYKMINYYFFKFINTSQIYKYFTELANCSGGVTDDFMQLKYFSSKGPPSSTNVHAASVY